MGCNLDLTPTRSVGFGEVGQIKVGTENCICGGNAPEPGESSTFPSGADWKVGAHMVCDPTGQSQDNECLGEEGFKLSRKEKQQ